MYPETDIPPVEITKEELDRVYANLPELPERRFERLQKEYKLNDKLAKQVLNSEYSELFETIVKGSNVSPTTVAAFLTETLKALKRDAVPVEKITDDQLRDIFKSVDEGKLAKEALSNVVEWLSRNEDRTIQEALNALGLQFISRDALEKSIERIVEDNKDLIKKRGEGSFGALMGIAMNSLRGRADAAVVSRVLKEKMKEVMK